METEGSDATAIFAQSVGGGGGNGGSTMGGHGLTAPTVAVALGGTGGTGGVGGEVDVTSSATVETEGDSSTGILAQSVGGGGGTGGYSITGGAKVSTASLTAAVGGSGERAWRAATSM